MNTSIAKDIAPEESARKVFEKLFRNEAVRTTCARLLADSIVFAHSMGPSCWALTLSSSWIRLNVGPVEVLFFRSNDIFLVIADSGDDRFSAGEYHDYIKPSGLHYPSVPIHQCLCNIPPEFIEKIYPQISENHRRFIQSAADRKKVTSWKRSFSRGLILYLQGLLKVTLPMPAYAPGTVQNQLLFSNPTENGARDHRLEERGSNRSPEVKEAIFQHQWDNELTNWINSSRNIENNLAESFRRFFVLAFENTSCRDQAWFGIHSPQVSLVVGGIFLAAIIKSGKDKGIWLLLKDTFAIDGWQSWDVRSTQASPNPLQWFHTSSFKQVEDVLDSPEIWESYRIASRQILKFPAIASDRDSVQKQRGKVRLSEIYTSSPNTLEEIEKFHSSYEDLQDTEREAVIQSRIGQGKFRNDLIAYWRKKCAVTGCQKVEMLRASHIKPWSEANHQERLDCYNGLLLVPNLDAAFDAGYISFSDDGKIMISRHLTKDDQNRLGIHPNLSIDGLSKQHVEYLQYHREHKFKG